MAGNVFITNELKNPAEVGVHYRLVCMTGPNKGKVYYLLGKRVVIGRGESADIQVVDVKMSREHAELSYSDHTYTITDLGTQNGIIVGDHKTKQEKLVDGDKVVIGDTAFKFNIIKVSISREMLLAENNPDSFLAKEIKKGVKVQVSNYGLNKKVKIENFIPEKINLKGKNKTRGILIATVAIAVAFVFLDDDKEGARKIDPLKSKQDLMDDFSESVIVRKSTDDPELRKKLDSLIHNGRREFREGNYFRAMEEFRLALLLSPSDGQSSFYLSKSKQRLDDEMMKNFEKGTQEQDAKKYQAAIVSFCSVVQLIKEYPDDERYKNAIIKISSIESALGLEKGEVKCFEERSADSRN